MKGQDRFSEESPMLLKYQHTVALLLASFLALPVCAWAQEDPSEAVPPADLPAPTVKKHESRLSRLLIRKSDLYLPTRLVMGEEARFVVKAQPGSHVKVFLSATGEGYMLPNGTPLRVGTDVQELTGVVPESGVLELSLEMPQDESLQGQVVYVDAVAGLSEAQLNPIDLVDPTGRRTDANTLVITKPADRGGPAILPAMPGVDPRLFNQLTQLGQIYGSKDESRKQLLDNGSINRDRALDQNPFAGRGLQQGIQP